MQANFLPPAKTVSSAHQQSPCPTRIPEFGSVRWSSICILPCIALSISLTVTGASTGLGRSTVEVALGKGEIVVATARRPATLDELVHQHLKDRLLILPLDTTKPDQVVDAFAEAIRTFGRIDVVFNNAGFGDIWELEGIEESRARAILETNFWGSMTVTKEAVKCFRETNPPGAGGRLLQMSSFAGLVGLPVAYYASSKFGASFLVISAIGWNTYSPPLLPRVCSSGGRV